MRIPRVRTLLLVLLAAAVSTSASLGQAPSARLQVSKSSGFLGIGSPRFVTVRLSTPSRDTALTSEAVNGAPLYYFVLKGDGSWLPDEDFLSAVVPTLRILQADSILVLESTSPLSRADSSLLVGFSKSLRVSLPFELMIGLEDEVFTSPFRVPPELWPGYPRLDSLTRQAHEARQAGAYRSAVSCLDSALLDPKLGDFPQLAALRELRTSTMAAFANNAFGRLDSAVTVRSIPLQQRVTVAERSARELQFAADSLQAVSLGITVSEPAMVALAARIRSQAARSVIVRDSLQQQADLERIGWIFKKGNHTKNGLLYAHMVEALAYAYSSVDVLDTAQTSFAVEIPASMRARLEEEDLIEDLNVFVRMCNDRYLHGVPLFPVEFLPTLRRDTAQHALPYFMLQAVSDYWSGHLDNARAASIAVLRRASDSLVVSRYDMLRMAVELRQGPLPNAGVRTLTDARKLLALGDTAGAASALEVGRNTPPISPVALLRGDLALSRRDTVGALGQYASAWLSDRRAVDAYLRGARLLRARGELQRATEILQLALDGGNEYWIVFYTLGIVLLERGAPSAALRALESALAIAPRDYETALGIGRAYQMSGNLRRAREYYNRAITFDPLRTEAVELLTALNRMNRPSR